MNKVAVREAKTEVVDAEYFSPVTVFDEARFEQIMRVATVMARATTIPEGIKGKSNNAEERFEETRGNCFMVCNLAANWEMDPFAVAQAISFLYGKMVFEGKLVRAVIRKILGFDLNYRFFGEPGSMDRRVYVSDGPMVDQDGNPLPESTIKEMMDRPEHQITTGTLKKWHTKDKNGGVNANWQQDEEKMFRERGAREWCREHRPGLMLGVYTNDEFDDIGNTVRSNYARDITPASNPLLDDREKIPMEKVENKEPVRNQPAEDTASVRQTEAGRESRPAARFAEFASALARMASVENVKKASMKFWEDNPPRPELGTEDYELAKRIYAKQLARAGGKVPAEGLLEEIQAEIDKSFGLDDFPGDR